MTEKHDSRISGPRDAGDPENRRYGHRSATGANEPKQSEKKEQHEDWIHRQGGDQTRSGESRPSNQERSS
jgi:hypothetical protein